MAREMLVLFNATIAFFLALLFVRAAVHKLEDRHRFQGILADYSILPEQALTAAAVAIPILEMTAAILLTVPTARSLGAVLAGALLALYALAMGIAVARGHYVMDCGCGDAPEPVSWTLVVRNAALIALAAPGAAGLAGGGTSLAENTTALATAVVFFLLWLAAEAMFSNARRMGESLPSVTRWSTP